ncbi:FG-GAP-like repeat-containing protein [Flavobacterium piscis]|uniref:RHS repeat-associated protein n=1 Tax=Flavobacterium piscis TaxID=1114874 RepID=A0ABU1Y8Q9_9FLAO|nr:FG-GAP-like repeat-containing protein [Flavobacterium piscis]MDR7210609.1 RHS repeat-associated protein [Flavobacterium piscis]
MKQFYFTLFFLSLCLLVSAQENEGIPAKDVTIIKGVDDGLAGKTVSTSKSASTAKSLTTATAPTGSSAEVGITEGQLTVSLNGAANYSVPILVPAGINGVQPQISLDYNSQRGLKGTAALGWDIGGISTITKIPATKFHDGVIDPVDNDNLDRFALDGQRLIVKNGNTVTYGGHGAVYETEYFSNLKITSYTMTPTGPEYFIVEYPDGSKGYYGISEQSRTSTDWSISVWESPQGARISYTYTKINNSLYIANIKYGALKDETPINEVQFLYGPRSSIESGYFAGPTAIIRDKILTEIKVTGNGLGFRNYVIGSPNKNQIKSITEKSGDNTKSYNPTIFDYGIANNNTDISYLSVPTTLDVGNIDSRNAATVTGDFDDDGKMDFLLYPTFGPDAKKKYWLYTNIASGMNLSTTHNVGAFENIFSTKWLSWNNKVMPQGWTVVKRTSTNYTFTVYSAGISNPIYEQYSKVVQFPHDNKIISGDFNGDGLTDVIAIETLLFKKVYFIDLKRDVTANYLFDTGELSVALNNNSKVEVADFNGDGKSDFFIFDNGSVRIYTLSATNTLILLHQITGDAAISLTKPILIGDYNGDGKSDFLIPSNYDNSLWYKYTSTGSVLIKEGKTFQPKLKSNTSKSTYDFIASDYNNDGRTDLINIESGRTVQGEDFGKINVGCYENINGDFPNHATRTTAFDYQINIYALPIYLPQSNKNLYNSVNQVYSTLEVAFVNKNKLHFFSSGYDVTKGNLLTKITTGNGVQEGIDYVPLDSRYKEDDYSYSSIYTPSTGTALYPNNDISINPNFFVVSKLEKQSKDVFKRKLFNYYGAVFNHEGLGFLGFRSVSQTNWHDDATPVFSSVTKNDIDLRGASTEGFTVANMYYPGNGPAPSNFVSKSITTYNTPVDALQSNKVFKLKMTNAKQFNALENTSTETKNIVYDANNNVTSSANLVKEGTSTVQTTTNTVTYEAPKTSPYIVGRPLSNEQSISVTGSTMTSKETYTYNSKELVSRIERKGNGTSVIYEDNEYDGFGNIIKKTITASGLTPREAKYEYESTGRFLTKITDAEKLVTTFVNNPNGTLKSETNPYLLTTSYTYDPWFKKLTVKDDKLDKTITYNYSRNTEKTVITTTTDVLDGSASEEIFDDLGRKIKSGVKNLNGNFSYVSYLYDIYDRNYKVSEPYFGSAPTQWNETKFDIYSRPIENISFNTRTITNEYSANSLTSKFIDGQKTKTAVKNAMGNIVSVNETVGGTINYSYYANGNLKRIDYNNVKIDIEQDEWGRKSKLTDPSAGVFTYKNNALGELTEETSQNGLVKTIITRDVNGKPIKKTVQGAGTDTETIYKYDTTTKLLTSTTFTDNKEPVGSNKITTTYTYDTTFKRIISIVEDKQSAYKFTTTIDSYDELGRIATETKKAELGAKVSTITTTNVYKNGDLYQIIDDTGKVLWQTNTVNAKGQVLEGILGNNIKMTNEYDTNGYLSKIKYDKTTTPTSNILTLTTEFDYKTDNLDNRMNSAFGNYTETFKYDGIDRLKEFTNKLGVQETQNYEPSGKIKDNNLGTYNYDVTKPYQNNSITPKPEATGYYANREGIFNDSMEDRTGWGTSRYPLTVFYSYDNTKVPHNQGKNTLKLANTTVNEQYVHSDKWIAIDNTQPTEYTYSAWIYSDGPQAEMVLFMKTPAETGYFTFVNSIITTDTGKWTKIEKTFLVPANIKKLNIRLDNNGLGNVWFDDVQIRRTSNPATTERKLDISYNAFKSPIQIEETGVDKISFTYNDSNQRSTMYYGSLGAKELRPFRKHYSADGSMEIKQNIATGAIEFVTYIGGDGYSAPIAAKSDGINPSQYLYLHRDYQGTILAITNGNATVVEKRLFDAWGGIIKVQDGAGNTLAGLTVLDRGYTGHEHLQSVALINMNARLYDPMLHRFLGIDNYIQDPTNTQNFNNYGYVMNNPLSNTDISGNICEGCGGIDIDYGGGEGSGGTSIDVDKWWKDSGLDKWTTKNLNFNSWGRTWKKIFGGGSSGPPPNVSKYKSVGTTGSGQHYGGDGSGGFMDYFSRFVYETDQFNPIALLWDGVKGNINGTDRYSNELTGFEANMKIVSAVPMTKVASVAVNASERGLSMMATKALTNGQLVEIAALKAERSIGGVGRFAGTSKHNYAINLLKRYERRFGSRGLSYNKYFNTKAGRGFLDIYDEANGIIYDFKFGKAFMSKATYEKYSASFNGASIYIIRP